MPVQKVLKSSSVPRRNKIAVLLVALLGWLLVTIIWPTSSNIKPHDWNDFAASISSTSASMVGLTVAVTALLYALLGTPLIGFLHERGALNRVIFDLIMCASFWLVALGCGLISSLPNFFYAQIILKIATSAAISGVLYFLPIGYAFWVLLVHSNDKPSSVFGHDFNEHGDVNFD